MAEGSALAFAVGYLAGSIPFSWILVRLTRKIDMRLYGSRTVSGSMVGVLVSKPAAVLVGILDILKAFLPVYLASKLFPESFLPMVVGLGAFIGHNWPVWLGFQGGRGVSVILGTALALFPWGVLWILLALGLGKVFNLGGVLVLISLATMPGLASLFHQPQPEVILFFLFFILTVIKRLEANREPLPGKGKKTVLLRRLLLDRDIKDPKAWLHRHPNSGRLR